MPALFNFVKFGLEVRMHPLLTFFNYSSLQKHKNIVHRESHIAHVQTDRVTHMYNIYIYIYINLQFIKTIIYTNLQFITFIKI